MIEVDRAVPTMFVSDLDAAVAWYERVLGFRVMFRITDPEYAGLSLGGAHIHLGKSEPPIITAAFYLQLTQGVDELVASIDAKGVPISPLKDQSYGMREATVHDPDGNEIYVGQPI